MPAPNWTADNVTEIAVLGRWTNGRPVVNVFYIEREEDDAEESARDLLNNWQDEIIPAVSNNYSLEGARYRDRNEEEGVVGTIGPDPAKPITGGSSVAAAPPNTSILVSKNFPRHVGQRSGRFYLQGVPEDVINEDGVLSPSYVSDVQDVVDAFLAGVTGFGENNLCVVHFSAPNDTTGVVTQVKSFTVQNRVATQRRRLRK